MCCYNQREISWCLGNKYRYNDHSRLSIHQRNGKAFLLSRLTWTVLELSKWQRPLEKSGMLTALTKFTKVTPKTFKSAEHWMSSYGLYEELPTNINSDWICLDVPNAYLEVFSERVTEVRSRYPEAIIIAGNVVTPEMTEQLLLAGADVVKVGIGPGSCCTTRKLTGVGYPQLSATIECADAAHGLGGHIMADGGLTCAGDIAKAFGAGADFVMAGGLFSGHNESGVEPDDDGNIIFYGMSSEKAMVKHYGEKAEYRASEGKVVSISHKGPVANTVEEILGGLRSTCTYIGAKRLKDMPKCTTFIRVNNQLNNIYGS